VQNESAHVKGFKSLRGRVNFIALSYYPESADAGTFPREMRTSAQVFIVIRKYLKTTFCLRKRVFEALLSFALNSYCSLNLLIHINAIIRIRF
jgi:hypothetical protein